MRYPNGNTTRYPSPLNPYADFATLQHVISVGGGFPSTIELPLLVLEKYKDCDLFISALDGESPDLWRLVEASEKLTGRHITRITYHPLRKWIVDAPQAMWWDIWDVFEQQGMMGNSLADPCSRVLKRETARHYVQYQYYEPAQTVMHFGIGADEMDRCVAIAANWQRLGYNVEFDLIAYTETENTKQRAKKLLGWVPQNYLIGMNHNNCGGFCVKAGHAQMARLLWYNRDFFFYHAQREKMFQEKRGVTSTIMRDRVTVNGKVESTPLTMFDFADRVMAKWGNRMFPPFDELQSTPGCVWCDAAA